MAVATYVGGESLADHVAGLLRQQLSPAGQEGLTETITSRPGREAASLVGVLGLAWGALKLFRGLDQAFDELYPDDVESSLLEQVRNGVVVVVGMGLAIGLVVAVGAALSLLPVGLPFASVLGSVVLTAVL